MTISFVLQRIVSTYPTEDTSEVSRAASEINTNFLKLSEKKLSTERASIKSPLEQKTAVVRQSEKAKKPLEKPSSNQGKVDALMSDFVKWLDASEGSAKQLLADSVEGEGFQARMAELEDSIVSMDCEFNMLRSQVRKGCFKLQMTTTYI